MTPAEKVLSRASGVRKAGPDRWMFKSPNRDDRTASVSMRELPDGKILLHDFGGDDLESLLCGLGLETHDLFPEPLTVTERPRRRSLISTTDALRILASESNLVAIAAANLAHGVSLTDEDRARLLTAAGRIQTIEREAHA
ncbi:DNA primase [Variovorax ginsengisoli]|uniref:DNA primase n=1 Tax=Variovorax ginsengisoli TaxID=363844 RepID=A0ABT8S6V9_9BURK|nr:DNA primase [Variovorax ginsengisoli]MDN8615485.1 DNA primase [Variovorax ginsengisoli]MDO1534655.1 DNA primase [Variovorax ginsengisoli]